MNQSPDGLSEVASSAAWFEDQRNMINEEHVDVLEDPTT